MFLKQIFGDYGELYYQWYFWENMFSSSLLQLLMAASETAITARV